MFVSVQQWQKEGRLSFRNSYGMALQWQRLNRIGGFALNEFYGFADDKADIFMPAFIRSRMTKIINEKMMMPRGYRDV